MACGVGRLMQLMEITAGARLHLSLMAARLWHCLANSCTTSDLPVCYIPQVRPLLICYSW